MRQEVGTLLYVSPEILKGDYTLATDMWSVGVLLYVLLAGQPPFMGKNDKETRELIKRGRYSLDGYKWSRFSPQVRDLISKLITSPDKRLTAAQALEHEWFSIYLRETVEKPKKKKVYIEPKKKKKEVSPNVFDDKDATQEIDQSLDISMP